MDDTTGTSETGRTSGSPTGDQAANILIREVAAAIKQGPAAIMSSPSDLAFLKQCTYIVCNHFRDHAQRRIHKHLVEIARCLPLVPSETVMLSLTDLATEQGIVEAGERICSCLPSELHWFVWQVLIPINWTTIDHSDYEGRIDRIRTRAKPGIKALEDEDHLAILEAWLPFHMQRRTQSEFAEHMGWESRKPLTNALKWWRKKTGEKFPKEFGQ